MALSGSRVRRRFRGRGREEKLTGVHRPGDGGHDATERAQTATTGDLWLQGHRPQPSRSTRRPDSSIQCEYTKETLENHLPPRIFLHEEPGCAESDAPQRVPAHSNGFFLCTGGMKAALEALKPQVEARDAISVSEPRTHGAFPCLPVCERGRNRCRWEGRRRAV